MEEYILLSASDAQFTISVAREYLRGWILCSDFMSLEEFKSTASHTVLKGLATDAERAGFLSFTYRPSAESPFYFPDFCRGGALVAFADFLSSILNENGHIDASKYLDALVEL